jgi:hypothetical protein
VSKILVAESLDFEMYERVAPSILLGGGISQVGMGFLILFPLFKINHGGDGYSQFESSAFPDDSINIRHRQTV